MDAQDVLVSAAVYVICFFLFLLVAAFFFDGPIVFVAALVAAGLATGAIKGFISKKF